MFDIIVTGACGFLGSHIVAKARAAGLSVLATGRATSDRSRLNALAPDTDFAVLDVTAPAETLALVTGQGRAMIHCAAYGVDYRQSSLEAALQINVLGPVALAEAAVQTHTRFVHVGTCYEYGPYEGVQSETLCPQPRGIYGVSKLAGTNAVLDRSGGAALVIRPFGMYGPLEGAHKLIPQVMTAMRTGKTLDLTPGEQIRDYNYVGDVAAGCVRAATLADFPAGEIINLCSGSGASLRTFVEAAADAAGGDKRLLNWGGRPYRPDEIMRTVGDNQKAAKLLGWHPATPLAAGMAQTADAERLRP